MIGFSANKAK